MKKTRSGNLSIVLAFMMAIIGMSGIGMIAYAADTDVVMTESTTSLTGGNVYIVNKNLTINPRINVQSGEVTLRFQNGATLNANHGIQVPTGTTLKIEGDGTLNAKVPDDYLNENLHSAIGGNARKDGGNITIDGEKLTVVAEAYCSAAIGGSIDVDYTGTVKILNGTVNAHGHTGAAGIGAGNSGMFKGTIDISGGTVKSYSYDTNNRGGAGIGTGLDGHMTGTINISGGFVHAEGSACGAGIGAGMRGNAGGGKVNISGGTVEAIGKNGAAGIGGGREGGWPSYYGGEGADVTITGGTVIAQSTVCAIGHGDDDSVMGTLTIDDKMKVYAGNNGTNYERDGMPFTAGERVPACQYRKNVRIEVCDHPGKTFEIDEDQHLQSCEYCKSTFEKEDHDMKEDFDSVVEPTCVQRGKKTDWKCTVCDYTITGEDLGYGPHDWTPARYTWRDGNTEATASRYCRRQPELREEETVNTTSEITKEPTCTNKGERTYTAVFNNYIFGTRTKTVEYGDIDPDAHVWGEWEVVMPPKVDKTGEKRRVCIEDPTHEEIVVIPMIDHNHELSLVDAKEATCTDEGNIKYYICDQGANPCNKCFSDADAYMEISSDETVIPAKGHNWDFRFDWIGSEEAGYDGVKAVYECLNDDSHNVTNDVTGDMVLNTTDPFCETSGKTTYSITVTSGPDGEKHSQSIDGKFVPALGHEWQNPSYLWQEEDGNEHAAMYGTIICNRETSHTVEETTENITKEVTKQPTCENKGETTYTATFTKEALPPKSDTVEDIAPVGHKWGEATYSWKLNEDSETEGTCTGLRRCERNLEHSLEETVDATFDGYEAPTCTEDGKVHCVSEEFTKEGFEKQEVDEIIPALGHDWDAWKVTKAATTTAEGEETRVCKRDGSHKETRAIPKKNDPSQDPNKKGTDGTAFGPGASAAAADKAITSLASDSDPKGTKYAPLTLKSTKQAKTSATVKWTKVSGATKYVLYGNKCGKKNKMKKLGEFTGSSKKVTKVAGKKLKKGTYYKFIVVALDKNNMVVSTSKVIHVTTKGGKYNNPKKVTSKKPKALKKGKSFKLKAKQTGKKIKKHRALKYESSNTKVATVSGKGVIKAKAKGTCYVYAYAQNGVSKKVKVTVK